MASKTTGDEEQGARDDEFSLIESIKTLAAYNARADLNDDKQLLLFLQSWWSKTYNRPLKDPILLSYTLPELLYEFYDKIERKKAEEERIELDQNKAEEQKEKETLDWAEQEEKKELEALKAQAAKEAIDPTKDPNNIAWMEEQISKAKTEFGQSFGEDIEESFE